MAATHPLSHPVTSNRILRALPDESLERIWRRLEPVDLIRLDVLYPAGAPVEHVYFIDRGLVSLLKSMSDGRAVEVGAIGREGVVCLSGAFGLRTAVVESVVQVPGLALRMNTAAFRELVELDPHLRETMLRYSQLALGQLTQTAACNRLHGLEERLCRWLLTAHDNAGSDSFRLTHEFLALMLGVQRPGVSLTAHALQDKGLIRYHNGEMTVADRAGLESAACECYRVMRRQIESLLGSQGED